MTPPVLIITPRSQTNTFASTEFDRDFKYGTADGTLSVLGSVKPAKKATHLGLILAWPKVTDKRNFIFGSRSCRTNIPDSLVNNILKAMQIHTNWS